MDKTNRIFFKDNPFPAGHNIVNFVWSGHLDQDKGLLFDFHLETDNYNAEDDTKDIDEPESDWKAKIAWNNFHSCTLSSTEWHFGGIVVGTLDNKFDFKNLTKNELYVDTLPLDEKFDLEDLAFHIYLLGHDSCANHRIVFSESQIDNTYDIYWTGKIALTYAGEEDFIYDFEANISNGKFAGIDLCDELDLESNEKLLETCTVDHRIFKLANGKFYPDSFY